MTIIAVLLGIIFFSIVRNQNIDTASKKMLKMFIVYWFISIVLASLRVFDIFEVGIYTFILIFLGIASFVSGYLIIANKRSPTIQMSKDDISSQVEKLSSNVIYRLVVIGASIYIYSLLVIFFDKLLFYGSLSNVRMDFYTADLYGPAFGQINAFILRPLYLVSLPVFAYLVLYKRSWLCLLLGFFLFGYESLGGGRIGYIRIVLAVVFLAYCLLDTFKEKKIQGYIILIVGGLLIFSLISVVSAARMGDVGMDSETRHTGAEKTLEHIMSYTACPIAAFDYSINHGYKELMGGYQFGNLTLTPVTSFINLFTSRIGLTIPTNLNELIEYKQNTPIMISQEMDWNALYTANLYYYLDFGILGVIFFPFILGLIVSGLVSKMYKYKSLPLVMIVSYCMWCMMDSVLDNAFHSPYDFMTLLIMYFWGTRQK